MHAVLTGSHQFHWQLISDLLCFCSGGPKTWSVRIAFSSIFFSATEIGMKSIQLWYSMSHQKKANPRSVRFVVSSRQYPSHIIFHCFFSFPPRYFVLELLIRCENNDRSLRAKSVWPEAPQPRCFFFAVSSWILCSFSIYLFFWILGGFWTVSYCFCFF